MRKNDITPKLFINFTDGYPGDGWGEEDYAETIFILHGTTTIKPPFGQYAYYKFSGEQ
jgi:hypothetical protein